MKKNKRNKGVVLTLIWIIAIILEWVNIPLFLFAMGYGYDTPIYNALDINPRTVAVYYYISAGIDILLFGILTLIYRAKKDVKNCLINLFCYLVQIGLLIYKIKL